MRIYVVGGAIRDKLLGKIEKDKDYVVVGSTPEKMISMGYHLVGRDFPVFLHPITKEEYALARTERKISIGYHGFKFYYGPDVTLKLDLMRRDLTINAMAQEVNKNGEIIGPIIDPYNGKLDLSIKKLRHISNAFSEDPVRILRIARFASRFTNFNIASETLYLMKEIVKRGELKSLAPERIWHDLSIGIMQEKPSRMFYILLKCNALFHVMPEINFLFNSAINEANLGKLAMMSIDYAAKKNYSLSVRFASLVKYCEDGAIYNTNQDINLNLIKTLCNRLRIQKKCYDLAKIVAHEYNNICCIKKLNSKEIVYLLERCDALRRPSRFLKVLEACKSDAYANIKNRKNNFSKIKKLRYALIKIKTVNIKNIVKQYLDEPEKIKKAIRVARINSLK